MLTMSLDISVSFLRHICFIVVVLLLSLLESFNEWNEVD